MNNQKSSKMSYLIIALVVAVALLGYFYWSGSKAPESMTLDIEEGANQAVGIRVLNLLNEINSLNIDNEFFKDPAYTSLRDHTVVIPPLPIGRSNPLSPIPGLILITPTTGR
jgi:hypothetical protein